MVQNQVAPTYQYATQTPAGLEDFPGHHQVVVSQPTTAVSAEAALGAVQPYKPEAFTAVTTVTPNGGVEQQTVRQPGQINVRLLSLYF